MKFGVALPSCYEGLIFPPPFSSPESIVRIGREAEAMGYDSVMPNDHFTTQNYVKALFPEPPNFFDPFICLSWVANATKRIELITGIAVLPVRDPVVLAKQTSTLDVFSGGRLKLGVGVGAYREEFEAVAPDRADR
ncbi:MAG: LLM class flavin-dependent oxidoreductase, partial [Chloroflexota bacterium]|nr:LLM class flavin-dependent oxidoreductase [Chloroflexota bacterium]